MNKVYVIWNPLYERVVCVHSSEDAECDLCIKAREEISHSHYSLSGKWCSIDLGIELCYCGNPVDLSNPECVKLKLCEKCMF